MSINDPYTPADYTRFTMRIKTELFDRVKELAEKDKRSAAKEIEFILEAYLSSLPKE